MCALYWGLWWSKPELWSESFWSAGNSNSGPDFVFGSTPGKTPEKQILFYLKINTFIFQTVTKHMLTHLFISFFKRGEWNAIIWFVSNGWIVWNWKCQVWGNEFSPVLNLRALQLIKKAHITHYQNKQQVNNHTTGDRSVCKVCGDSSFSTIH